jgi:hypothetical protein
MEISLKENEHFSFSSNDTNLLSINEKGMDFIITTIFTDEDFKQKLFTREFAAETIDVLLGNKICRQMVFEAIKGNPEYKDQMRKILSAEEKSS